jgi:hypothetical protein
VSDEDDVLPGFEEEVREHTSIWRNPGNVPRMEVRRHRDGSITRVMVRSEKGANDNTRAVTIHFSGAEWALLERAILAGLGLAKAEPGE